MNFNETVFGGLVLEILYAKVFDVSVVNGRF